MLASAKRKKNKIKAINYNELRTHWSAKENLNELDLKKIVFIVRKLNS